MIWCVEGKLELYICSECGERWVGQGGEPRTQEWLAGHAKHTQLAGLNGKMTVPEGNPPFGFGRFT